MEGEKGREGGRERGRKEMKRKIGWDRERR